MTANTVLAPHFRHALNATGINATRVTVPAQPADRMDSDRPAQPAYSKFTLFASNPYEGPFVSFGSFDPQQDAFKLDGTMLPVFYDRFALPYDRTEEDYYKPVPADEMLAVFAHTREFVQNLGNEPQIVGSILTYMYAAAAAGRGFDSTLASDMYSIEDICKLINAGISTTHFAKAINKRIPIATILDNPGINLGLLFEMF